MLELDIQIHTPTKLEICANTHSPITGLLGTSGSGKTTLLRSLCGLNPSVGSVLLNGIAQQQLPTHHKGITLVQQTSQLVPHWTIQQHIKKTADKASPLDHSMLIKALGLTELLNKKPRQLSGGQLQRAALLLALLRSPKLLLLDEPFTALDEASKQTLFPVLIESLKTMSAQAILVSHQLRDIASLCGQLWELTDQGNIQQKPLIEGLQSYRGKSEFNSLLTARYQGIQSDHALHGFQLVDPVLGHQTLFASGYCHYLEGQQLRLSISADDVGISLNPQHNSSFANDLRATIKRIETDHYGALIHCLIGQQIILAHITQFSLTNLALQKGDQVQLVFKAGAVDILGIH